METNFRPAEAAARRLERVNPTVAAAIDGPVRGDFEALLEHFDPAVVLHDPGRTGRSFHGHDGLMQFWGEWIVSPWR